MAVLVLGCAKHHRVEDFVVVDTGVDADLRDARGFDASVDAARVDAGPDAMLRDGVHWRLERRSAAYLRIPNETGCFTVEGGLAVIEVGLGINHTCEYGGPVQVTRTPDESFVVESFVWVRHPVTEELGCFGVAALETRTVQIVVASETYTVREDLGGHSLTFTIPERDGPPCAESGGEGAACQRNCDCQFGLFCVPALGDFVECYGGQCRRACDIPSSDRPPIYSFDFDCLENESCEHVGLARPVCASRSDDCTPDECGAGTRCTPGGIASSCRWEIELDSAVRHPCGSDADCETPGTYCVEHASGERRCEVPCFTQRQRCPRGHLCDASWVCEWVGE